MSDLIPIEQIASRIYLIRGQKVMLDSDLAQLYGVETAQLKRQVRRNRDRFPADFLIELKTEEYQDLSRCQFGTLKRGKHSKYLPYAFTEQGVAMLSSVINSKKAIYVNIQIMRAFVRIRQYLATHKELARKVEEIDKNVKLIFRTLHQIMDPPEPTKKKIIGFQP